MVVDGHGFLLILASEGRTVPADRGVVFSRESRSACPTRAGACPERGGRQTSPVAAMLLGFASLLLTQ